MQVQGKARPPINLVGAPVARGWRWAAGASGLVSGAPQLHLCRGVAPRLGAASDSGPAPRGSWTPGGAVASREVLHERLALHAGADQCYVLTPDGDQYAEPSVEAHADIAALHLSRAQGAEMWGVRAEDTYRFRALPADAALEGMMDLAARHMNAVPAVRLAIRLGPGNVRGAPPGEVVLREAPPAVPLAGQPVAAAQPALGGEVQALAQALGVPGGAPLPQPPVAGIGAGGPVAVGGQLPADASDARVLTVTMDAHGKQHLDFRAAIYRMQLWPCGHGDLPGPRTLLHVVRHMAKHGPTEYYGAAMGLAGGMHVQTLVAFFGYRTAHYLEFDAQSAIAIASRRGLGALRHIKVQYLWVQGVVQDKRVHLGMVKRTENFPDIGTKRLPTAAFKRYRSQLGLSLLEDAAAAGCAVVAATSRSPSRWMWLGCCALVSGSAEAADELALPVTTGVPSDAGVPGACCLIAGALAAVACLAGCAAVAASRSWAEPRRGDSRRAPGPRAPDAAPGKSRRRRAYLTAKGKCVHLRRDCSTLGHSTAVEERAICPQCGGVAAPRWILDESRAHARRDCPGVDDGGQVLERALCRVCS